MFKQLSLTAAVALAFTFFLHTPTNAQSFSDVKNDEELIFAVEYLSTAGIINGFEDGTYRPNANVTRGQAAKIIAGALELNSSNPASIQYADVKQSNIFYPYIAALADIGIFDKNAKNFRPNDSMTRAEMAKVISMAFDFYYEEDLPFTDVYGHWSEQYVGQLYATKVTKGVSNSLFGVNQPVTRGQLAKFIVRAQDYVYLSRETVSAESLDYDEIDGFIYSYIGNSDAVRARTKHNAVMFEAAEEGIAYGYVENASIDSEDYATKATFYQFEVVMRDGHLVLIKTELDERPNVPAIVTIYESVKDYNLFYFDGTLVDESKYELVQEYESYADMFIYGEYGDFILQYTNEDDVNYQLLVTITDDLSYPYADYTDYVFGDVYISTNSIWQEFDVDVGRIIDVMAVNEEGEAISEDRIGINFSDDVVTLTPKDTAYFELVIVGSKEDAVITIWFEQYGDGYTMVWY